jgi:hypothetical protein
MKSRQKRRRGTAAKMSKSATPERPQALSAKKPTPHFNWPPTEERLTQRSAEPAPRLNSQLDRPTDLDPPRTNIETLRSEASRPRADFSWPPTADQLAAGGFAGTRNVAGVASPSRAGGGQAMVRDDDAVRDSVPTLSQTDAPSYIGDSRTAIPVAQSEAAFDGIGTGDWAADLARLQAALERVTEKLEWRITSVTGH